MDTKKSCSSNKKLEVNLNKPKGKNMNGNNKLVHILARDTQKIIDEKIKDGVPEIINREWKPYLQNNRKVTLARAYKIMDRVYDLGAWEFKLVDPTDEIR